MSLNSGERQVSPSIHGIRRDHVARYEWAAKQLPHWCGERIPYYIESTPDIQRRFERKTNCKVIDFACGIGYGARILADAGHSAHGFDIDAEAITYANEHYRSQNGRTDFSIGNGNAPGELGEYDAAISFETIEHIEDPRPLLIALRKSAPVLIASVPNEDVMPWQRADGATTAFHFRHYTKREFNDLLTECGWHVTGWHGQAGPESEVELDMPGRTLIAVCERGELPKQEDIPQERHIAILGLGPSLDQYLEITKRRGGRSNFCDETWAINALGDVFACDLVFHMDDIRIQEIRTEAAPASNIAAMVRWIKTSPVPVVTSRIHPNYPALVEFPLEDVLNNLGHDYFNSTAAYAIAFAIHTRATEISIFGMDFSYPNVHDAEKGRACVEFWLGQAHARGIKLNMPKNTTLMDAMYPRASRLYGYDTLDVAFNLQADGTVKLGFNPRETLPTAEQIERNYDHSAPIEKQHQTMKD
jgi:SAM-dependent methyltransferase